MSEKDLGAPIGSLFYPGFAGHVFDDMSDEVHGVLSPHLHTHIQLCLLVGSLQNITASSLPAEP